MKVFFAALLIGLVLLIAPADAQAEDFVNDENEDQYESTQDDVDDAQPLPSKSELIQQSKQAQQAESAKAHDPPPQASQPPPLAAAPAPAAATPAPQAAADSAKAAQKAAQIANKVAKHSKKIIHSSQKALKHALGALHDARVDASGLNKQQKKTLKKAEAHLRKATKKTDYGKLEKLKANFKDAKLVDERAQMMKDIEDIRKQLKEKNIADKDIENALDELEADLNGSKGPVSDESKAELERIRQLVNSMDAKEDEAPPQPAQPPSKEQPAAQQIKEEAPQSLKPLPDASEEQVTPVEQKGLDIDTQMPYGDLEPFGREDTAQELTENSIRESDEMVDQLERAEVSEEKRAVFRALTRLRGAAITSFDGVARAQTGNIDEYDKTHQWRSSHPLHHLADEESDVSKWAFPDNAD